MQSLRSAVARSIIPIRFNRDRNLEGPCFCTSAQSSYLGRAEARPSSSKFESQSFRTRLTLTILLTLSEITVALHALGADLFNRFEVAVFILVVHLTDLADLGIVVLIVGGRALDLAEVE